MGRGKTAPSMGNGGIMGTGVFGMFGTVVNCKAEDTSAYCEFVKFFNVFFMVLVIFIIVYSVYMFSKSWFSSSRIGKRGR